MIISLLEKAVIIAFAMKDCYDIFVSDMKIPKEDPHSIYLSALWHEARGNWVRAHEIVQDLDGKEAAWIHAYLHRKEGDLWNARYWYDRAGRDESKCSFDVEWQMIWDELSRKTR